MTVLNFQNVSADLRKIAASASDDLNAFGGSRHVYNAEYADTDLNYLTARALREAVTFNIFVSGQLSIFKIGRDDGEGVGVFDGCLGGKGTAFYRFDPFGGGVRPPLSPVK